MLVTRTCLLELLGSSGCSLAELALTPAQLARLLELVRDKRVTNDSGRKIFAEMARSGAEPAAVMAERGLEAMSDSGEIESLARAVIEANPKQ
ncbi:MAG: Asp-tRNA(Asn)/Glu-tRNA(Gln) amidotransferase subunit GatB, partial [Acidobacteria bacterium]|nr:Asp-tRNA(Asn)/Glu-tRNA(Gln) amidotransferase subunit GatB [Acidobacteriota bacterium]